MFELSQYGAICIGNIVLIKKYEITEIEVYLGSNLNFTISDFTWGNDFNICEKNILSNLINNTIN